MPEESTEQPIQQNLSREFHLGRTKETSVLQKGRITKLSNPNFGVAYLIDVTDREDPTDPAFKGKTIGEVFKEELEDANYNNRYSSDINGVVAAVTDKLDPQNRKRIYVGLASKDVDAPQNREITTSILRSEAFQFDSGFYVPFAFAAGEDNPFIVVGELMRKEIQDAVKEAGDPKPFPELTKPAAMLKPAA